MTHLPSIPKWLLNLSLMLKSPFIFHITFEVNWNFYGNFTHTSSGFPSDVTVATLASLMFWNIPGVPLTQGYPFGSIHRNRRWGVLPEHWAEWHMHPTRDSRFCHLRTFTSLFMVSLFLLEHWFLNQGRFCLLGDMWQ